MIGFFINIYRLVAAVGYGLRKDADFRGLMVLILKGLVDGEILILELITLILLRHIMVPMEVRVRLMQLQGFQLLHRNLP